MTTPGDQPPRTSPEDLRATGEAAAMRGMEWAEAVREGREPAPHAEETAVADLLTAIYLELRRLADLLSPPGGFTPDIPP